MTTARELLIKLHEDAVGLRNKLQERRNLLDVRIAELDAELENLKENIARLGEKESGSSA